MPALVNSGFPNDRFVFEGFLPAKKGRQTRLLELAEETRTMIFYESPHKLLKTLAHFAEYFGRDTGRFLFLENSPSYLKKHNVALSQKC